MPAIITHHLFGEEASRNLPEGHILADEELLAFLLGNQGPDPFACCFSASLLTMKAFRTFAQLWHAGQVIEALRAARDAVTSLPAQDQGVGRAFAWGLLAHYLLDSEGHAFVRAQEDALCASGVGLEDAHREVHYLIESELDTWMLWNARHQTIGDAPAWSMLARSDRVTRVAGSIFSQAAWQVFEITLRPDSYGCCLGDYERVYRLIDPKGNPRSRVLAKLGKFSKYASMLDALAHASDPTDDCPAANLSCHPWVDPLTGEEVATSFPDVFFDALKHWPSLVSAYEWDDQDALEQLMRRDYQGNARTTTSEPELGQTD